MLHAVYAFLVTFYVLSGLQPSKLNRVWRVT